MPDIVSPLDAINEAWTRAVEVSNDLNSESVTFFNYGIAAATGVVDPSEFLGAAAQVPSSAADTSAVRDPDNVQAPIITATALAAPADIVVPTLAANTATAATITNPVMTPATLNFTPNVDEPDVYIPQIADAASIEKYDEWYQKISDDLVDKFVWFLTNYFPNDCAYLQKAQQWICKVLTDGGTGMNKAVEDQIWQRDRTRVLRDAARAEEEVIGTWASRGFPLPPGAAIAGVNRIRQDAQDKIAQASRDVAIKQAEIEIENVRFAVEKAIDLYTKAINAAGDFIKTFATPVGSLTQLIPSQTDAQSRLISAASQYYGARIQVEELRLKATLPNSEWKQAANTKNAEMSLQAQTTNGTFQQNISVKNAEFAFQAASENAKNRFQAAVANNANQFQAASKSADNQMAAVTKTGEFAMQAAIADVDFQLKADVARLGPGVQVAIKNAELTQQMEVRNKEHQAARSLKITDVDMDLAKLKVQAAVSAAQSLGTQAAAAFNTLHASASISGSNNVGTSYSASGDIDSDVAWPTPQ